ncbi:Conserved hypothetical protein [Seminavis robusta]|uniref:Uncharacterized protein n=1 Tax=Seminavis robusta TaxID=568900 RepID=A0A9N8HYE7_9STRA|nr:Conserved hypothetical protein [Seminavis robusta]|eukprot:Sro1983_g309230.1 Conserved hypothetical protein (225) ;mRNA; r:3835-4509
MGQCIAKVGRMVSRVCRVFCEQHGVLVDLENILTESLNCKARLLHYFEANNNSTQPDEGDQLWCGWHNDHGSLTGLVPAMYLSTQKPQKQLPAAPDSNAGLYIHSRSNEVVKVSLPTDCIGYQIGETFQILSGGLLQATPHAVKSTLTKGVTREAFAVFLEPEYEFPMTIPEGRTVDDCCCPDNPANKALKLNSIKSRWKKGMCFGEFNNITIQTFHKQLDAAE